MSSAGAARTGTGRCLVINDRRPVPTGITDRLRGRLDVEWLQRPGGTVDPATELAARPHITALVTTYLDLSARHLRLLPRLEIIVATTAAVEYIDLDYCRDRGIVVCNSADYTGAAVAEHAIALLLAVAKCIVPVHARVRDGDMLCFAHQSVELAGSTAGVIGMGHIGTGIARLASGLGMDVVFANRGPRQVQGARQVGVRELLAGSDAVFLALPLTPESDGMIGGAELDLMKSEAMLVSIAPDPVVDAAALTAALASGAIRGAGLDLLGARNPYPPLDNLVLSPRFAAATGACQKRRQDTWIAALAAFAAGTEPRNRVV